MMPTNHNDHFDFEDHIFENPSKLIRTIEDMAIWEKSEAYHEYLGFILAINEAVKGKANSKGKENASETINNLVELLNVLDKYIDETPPVTQPQRFGNQAFKVWYNKVKNNGLTLLESVLPEQFYKAITEIVVYLIDGFGNATRIDYGTGHEISFLMFLCSLFKIGLLKDEDRLGVGCVVFPRYLEVCRKLQQVYRMEPAGSHGVWSLDDYQFVPFIWGSSQLYGHGRIEPPSILKPEIVNENANEYIFLSCIQYINEVKTGPFAEHSNQLWNISGVSSWSKVNGGLIKMYKVEVLSKFPVAQHIVFGSLFTLKVIEQSMGMMTAKTSPTRHPKSVFKEPGKPLSLQVSRTRSSEGSSKSDSDVRTASIRTASSQLGNVSVQTADTQQEGISRSIRTVDTRDSIRTAETASARSTSIQSERKSVGSTMSKNE